MVFKSGLGFIMATFHEIEEIKQAQLRALSEARAKYDAIQSSPPEIRENTAELLILPFGTVDGEGDRAARSGAKTTSSPGHAVLHTGAPIASHATEPEAPSLLVSGGATLIGIAILGVMLRRIWHDLA